MTIRPLCNVPVRFPGIQSHFDDASSYDPSLTGGGGVGVRLVVSANRYCHYPLPLCVPWSGHIGQGRNRHGILPSLYRTSGVIFFIDYCTAIRDT